MNMPFLKIVLPVILLLYFPIVATSQVIKHSYRFYNYFLVSAPECGPSLIQAQALGNCNASGSPGSFVTDTLPYCGITRTVYHNNLHWGLRYPNTNGTITSTYTIHLYVKNISWGNGVWSRIIDFSNGTSDAGIYYKSFGSSANRCLDFYPSGIVGACPYFTTSQYYLLTFTRNGANNNIDVYINNTLFTSYNDASGRYVGIAGTPIFIYRDDQVVTCESGEANFAYLAFTNEYSPQATVNAVYSNICTIANTTNAADFTVTPNNSCSLSQNIAITYTGDIVLPGAGYTFNWDWDGGTVVSGSGIGPYQVVWSTPGTKNIRLTVTNTSCGNQYIKTKQLVLRAGSAITISRSICQGQSYLGYNTTGVYTDTFSTANGCDSIRILNLTVNPRPTLTITRSICQGQSYLGYSTSGTYMDTFAIPNGCDSIRTLNLTVKPKRTTTITQSICQGQSYLNYSTSGIYVDTFTAANGCDSIRTLQLTVNEKVTSTVNIAVCQGRSYYGYSTSGVYVDTFASIGGCDSIRTLHLTVTSYDIVNRNVSICEGEKYFAGGSAQTAAGIYYDTVIANANCGSVIITNLAVNPVPQLNAGPGIQLCFGDSVVLNPGSYTNYLWSNNSVLPTLVIRTPGRYWVRVTNMYNCKAADTVIVSSLICKDIKIPNVFSPNNDGINDTWRINQLQYLANVAVEIYNRWGQIVYKSVGYSKPWDGTYNGNKVPAGTYYYIINTPELKQKFTGWVFVVQ